MKKMNNKKAYMAPMVEVMNARVERGFQGSGEGVITNTGLEPVNNQTTNTINGDEDFD